MTRTAIALFVDDTHFQPKGQFGKLVDFCAEQGVRGKFSLISAMGPNRGGLATGQTLSPAEAEFLHEIGRAATFAMDIHMELMTHDKLWDFAAGQQRSDGPCEGMWLYDPDTPKAEYVDYLGAILDHAARLGITINGVSVPGCACDECARRWVDLQARGHLTVSANAYEALLDLAAAGRMGVASVAVYADEADADHPTRTMCRRGEYSVYDARLDLVGADLIGFNGKLDVDFYVSADGQSGRIVQLVQAGAPSCFFCAHWFSMNPAQPEGWQGFQEIIRRINTHLADRIEWVRPSDYGARLAG
jgi:hypothetical protein